MGSSIPTNGSSDPIAPTQTQPVSTNIKGQSTLAPVQPVQQISVPARPVIQNCEETVPDSPDQASRKMIVPERISNAGNNCEAVLTFSNKPSVRELPPLKKVRSQKRITETAIPVTQIKEATVMIEKTAPSSKTLSKADISDMDIDVKENQGDTGNKCSEVRLRKVRISKNSSTPGPYF